MKIRTLLIGAALAALATAGVGAGQDLHSSSCRTGCRRRTHCRKRWRNGARRSRRRRTEPSSRTSIRPSNSARRPDHYDMTRDGIVDFAYINPGYQPGRFPIVSAGELPFLVGEAHGGIRADRCLVPQVRPGRDEGREALLLVHSRSVADALAQQEGRGAERHQGHEDPSVAGHHGVMGDAARRHQRVIESVGNP